MKSDFLLDPSIHFLNHGSFGACPRPVLEAYQHWQRELEAQPVAFLGRRVAQLMAESRAALAAYLGTERDDIVYFPNPTTAINMVVRNLVRPDSPVRLSSGDQILTTDHEYGAMDRTWRYACGLVGADYVQRPIPLPVSTHADFVEHLWGGVNERTRVLFLSHITSPTALILPVAELCQRARQAGILTIVDGAHAPGQLAIALRTLEADIYVGACHKWLCAPKGAAFLYARPEVQGWLEPLVISWGWQADEPGPSPFVDWHEWQGTRDVAAYLSVPAAIRYQAEHRWEAVRRACHELASQARARISDLTALPLISPESTGPIDCGADAQSAAQGAGAWYGQMCAVWLPECDPDALKARLYNEHRVEAPLFRWNKQPLIRLSFQAYNDQSDVDAVVDGLSRLVGRVA